MNGLRAFFPNLRCSLLLFADSLIRFADRNGRRFLALLVLEVGSRDRQGVLRENIWRFSLTRYGNSQKRSRGQRRESKFDDVFHFKLFFFVSGISRFTQVKTLTALKPFRKIMGPLR
jgi:hypothetical protein